MIRFPGAELRLSDAEVLVTLPSRQAEALSALLLRPAAAGSAPSVELLCRRGSCRISWEGRECLVLAGTAAILAPGAPPGLHPRSPEAVEQATAWIWQAAPGIGLDGLAGKAEGLSATWTGKTLLLVVEGFGRLPLGPAPDGDFRLELSVRPRRTAGDLGLAIPARTRCPYWVMGATPLPGGRWTRLAAERHGDWVRLWRDGGLVASLAAAASDGLTPASDRPALGLWGADVEVRDLVWKVFPP